MIIEQITKLNTIIEAIEENHSNIKNLQVLHANDSEIMACIEFHDISYLEWHVYGIKVDSECVCIVYENEYHKQRVEHYKYAHPIDLRDVIIAALEEDDEVLEKHKK